MVTLPKIYEKASLAKVNKKYPTEFLKIRDWVNVGGNLLLVGEPGRGKTYTAAALTHYFAQRERLPPIPYHEQRFIEIADLNQKWLAGISSYFDNYEFLEKLKNCMILILDDIGVKKPSDAFLDYLYTLINHRCNRPELRTIYTTNLNSKELNDSLGSRIVSRISSGVVAKFDGGDLRYGK